MAEAGLSTREEAVLSEFVAEVIDIDGVEAIAYRAKSAGVTLYVVTKDFQFGRWVTLKRKFGPMRKKFRRPLECKLVVSKGKRLSRLLPSGVEFLLQQGR